MDLDLTPIQNNTDPNPTRRRLSFEFLKLKTLCDQDVVSLGVLINSMTERSHAILTLVFGCPFLLPIPMPGVSVVFGLIIMLIGTAMALGKPPWIPQKFLKREVSSQILRKVFEGGFKLSQKLEKYIKPRGVFILRHPWINRMNGALIAACGLLLALPFPPGTNFPPGTAIILLSLGSLEEDILFLFLGYVAFVLNLIFFAGITLLGANGVKFLLF